MSSAEARNQ